MLGLSARWCAHLGGKGTEFGVPIELPKFFLQLGISFLLEETRYATKTKRVWVLHLVEFAIVELRVDGLKGLFQLSMVAPDLEATRFEARDWLLSLFRTQELVHRPVGAILVAVCSWEDGSEGLLHGFFGNKPSVDVRRNKEKVMQCESARLSYFLEAFVVCVCCSELVRPDSVADVVCFGCKPVSFLSSSDTPTT